MSSRRRQADDVATAAPAPIVPALDIRPEGVYRPHQVIAALGLRTSSLRTECRNGRLKMRRRCGRNYLLGSDILAWLRADDAELSLSPKHRHQHNGATV